MDNWWSWMKLCNYDIYMYICGYISNMLETKLFRRLLHPSFPTAFLDIFLGVLEAKLDIAP